MRAAGWQGKSALVAALVGLGVVVAPRPWNTPAPSASQTVDEAKQALLDLMATRDRGPVGQRDEERFAGEPVEDQGGGLATWGPFQLDLVAGLYTFTLTYGSPPMMSMEGYEGAFERRGGRLVALPPRLRRHLSGVSHG